MAESPARFDSSIDLSRDASVSETDYNTSWEDGNTFLDADHTEGKSNLPGCKIEYCQTEDKKWHFVNYVVPDSSHDISFDSYASDEDDEGYGIQDEDPDMSQHELSFHVSDLPATDKIDFDLLADLSSPRRKFQSSFVDSR